jgi:hypothetical protein
MNNLRLPAALCAGLIALASVGATRADYNFDLGTGNYGLDGFTGPFEHVDVHLTDSTHATITFTSYANAKGQIYLMGDGGTVGVNVNAKTWTVTGLTASNNLGGPFQNDYSRLQSAGAANEDGFGSFNQTFQNFDGFNWSFNKVSFTLTNTGGTWAADTAVLAGNVNGYKAASHVFIANADLSNTNVTGFATSDGSGGIVTPAPPSAVLLGVGAALCGFAGWSRRRPVRVGA